METADAIGGHQGNPNSSNREPQAGVRCLPACLPARLLLLFSAPAPLEQCKSASCACSKGTAASQPPAAEHPRCAWAGGGATGSGWGGATGDVLPCRAMHFPAAYSAPICSQGTPSLPASARPLLPRLLPYGVRCTALSPSAVRWKGACCSWCSMPRPPGESPQNTRCISSTDVSSLVGGAVSRAAGERSSSGDGARDGRESLGATRLRQRAAPALAPKARARRGAPRRTHEPVLLQQVGVGVHPLPRRGRHFLQERGGRVATQRGQTVGVTRACKQRGKGASCFFLKKTFFCEKRESCFS